MPTQSTTPKHEVKTACPRRAQRPSTSVPYAMEPERGRRKYGEDQMFLTVWDDNKPKKNEVCLDAENRTRRSWFKVTIPNGKKYDKTWLINSMQDQCRVPFIPVDFHYDKQQARFFVQHASTAYALKDISHKISDETSQKIPIFVNRSVVPYSVQNKFTSEQMEQIKVTLMKRYDASQKALDLEKFRFDQELMNNDIDIMLNRRSCMVVILQIIQSNIPELSALNLCDNKLYQLDGLSNVIEKAPQVKILNLSKNKLKSVWELEKVKELNLEELWLEGNPLMARSYYYQHEWTYYMFYDNGDRLHLINAYHDEACFSLAVTFNFNDPNLSNLEEYFKYNRDIKKLKDSNMRMRLLKHNKHNIVASLNLLPKTQHDLCSFWMDLCYHTDMMLCFSVNGLFKEVEGKFQGCIRAFTRIFITTHHSNSRICIMNDELIVRNASPKEIQNAFNSLPTANVSSKSPLSEQQQEMVKSFSMQSKMKPNWSQ
ncbi:hypothetical protein A6R68_10712, partial [Neotoma lepida]